MVALGQAELELAQARAAAAEAKAALAAAKADGPSGPGPSGPGPSGPGGGGGVPVAAAPGAWRRIRIRIDADRGCQMLLHQFLWNCGSPTRTSQDSQIHTIMIKALYHSIPIYPFC